jgi:two-component sensor histidine kinase
VEDDGPGLPPDFDPAVQASVGLQIVQMLVESDLRGELALRHGRGACWEIRVPTAP